MLKTETSVCICVAQRQKKIKNKVCLMNFRINLILNDVCEINIVF